MRKLGRVAGIWFLLCEIATAQPIGTSFTYQGQLIRNGAAVTAACDFQFKLFDAASGGMQTGPTVGANGVTVNNGVFTVTLDFGDQFRGDARWLQTAVKCPADALFVTLQPTQALTATPYALGLRPGTVIQTDEQIEAAFDVVSQNANNPIAIRGVTTSGTGSVGVYGESASSNGYGVLGVGLNGGAGVGGAVQMGFGVEGQSAGQAGVFGTTTSTSGSGVQGNAAGANAAGVFGLNDEGPGIWGRAVGAGAGVYGEGQILGVRGNSISGNGVYGTAAAGTGVLGAGFFGVVGGTDGSQDSQAIRGDAGNGSNTVGYAGVFLGRVSVFGTLFKQSGAFRIDHPLDPAGKYLSHSFVESPDMKNIYDGVVVLDENGEAVVELPNWFGALNRDFRYQLTCIGGHAPVFVAEEIADNRFKIAGGSDGLQVSWQVTGTRQDPFAEANRIQVEEDKPATEKGTYIYPDGYGMPRAMGMAAHLSRSPMQSPSSPLPSRPNSTAD